ncbi:maleylpyruvate isomerase N-terminal domain-containing protein [Nocardioides sp. zg-1228]|uniref:maleylpyruvate isomerase N-terminal domain-containing protein n=1 Tax=Nocardioides sp. zg-1228 TaxID=2763008 RepID=UPI0019820CC8|nr:maleylpyruvate isomerase N-terminal domain-containing protein [Nocardioides sp. zg-1228]
MARVPVNDLLAESYDALAGVVGGLGEEDGWAPTGCRGWAVRDLVWHLHADAVRGLVAAHTPAGRAPDCDAVGYWRSWGSRPGGRRAQPARHAGRGRPGRLRRPARALPRGRGRSPARRRLPAGRDGAGDAGARAARRRPREHPGGRGDAAPRRPGRAPRRRRSHRRGPRGGATGGRGSPGPSAPGLVGPAGGPGGHRARRAERRRAPGPGGTGRPGLQLSRSSAAAVVDSG